jgi:hypothetical protein
LIFASPIQDSSSRALFLPYRLGLVVNQPERQFISRAFGNKKICLEIWQSIKSKLYATVLIARINNLSKKVHLVPLNGSQFDDYGFGRFWLESNSKNSIKLFAFKADVFYG